jgi:hypothetical protein
MFMEAEQARLADRTQKAKEQVSDGLRRLAEQRSLVEELERRSRSSGAAKLALVSLLAAQRRAEDYYRQLVAHSNSSCETPTASYTALCRRLVP